MCTLDHPEGAYTARLPELPVSRLYGVIEGVLTNYLMMIHAATR